MKKKPIDFFKIPKYDGTGIYAIISWEDFKCYVGSSKNIKNRAKQHKDNLIKGIHPNKNLQEAYNDGKILRFVVLKKIDSDISSEERLIIEYCFMLGMKYNCFKLYNIAPEYKKNGELENHIVLKVAGMCGICDIPKAIKKEYGIHPGYMLNTKYREWKAKQQIKI